MGHPANRPNLEQDFTDLLEGKAITGAGTSPGGGDGDDEEEKGTVAAEEADEAVAKFNADSDTILQTDATKNAVEGMPRCFCVLVHDQKFDMKTKKLTHKM